MLIPVGRSIWAILAGYMGLLSVLIFPAPLAVLFGILAIREIKRNPKKHGMGRAIFGIVCGVLAMGTVVAFVVIPFVLRR
jgi:predicted acyltransferase